MKFYPYPESSSLHREYYTEDPIITKNIKSARRIDKASAWMLALSVIFFIAGLITIEATNWKTLFSIILVVTLIIGTFCLSLTLAGIAHSKYMKWITIYEESEERHAQFLAHVKEQEEAEDKYLTELATDLVESYEILENKKMPKETKINLLKEYIDRGEKRRR